MRKTLLSAGILIALMIIAGAVSVAAADIKVICANA
jgi:hypothetical protein